MNICKRGCWFICVCLFQMLMYLAGLVKRVLIQPDRMVTRRLIRGSAHTILGLKSVAQLPFTFQPDNPEKV